MTGTSRHGERERERDARVTMTGTSRHGERERERDARVTMTGTSRHGERERDARVTMTGTSRHGERERDARVTMTGTSRHGEREREWGGGGGGRGLVYTHKAGKRTEIWLWLAVSAELSTQDRSSDMTKGLWVRVGSQVQAERGWWPVMVDDVDRYRHGNFAAICTDGKSIENALSLSAPRPLPLFSVLASLSLSRFFLFLFLSLSVRCCRYISCLAILSPPISLSLSLLPPLFPFSSPFPSYS